MAIIGLPTNQGLSILTTNLRENVKKFALFGTDSPTGNVPFDENSSLASLANYLIAKFQVTQAYFDENGTLTFECAIPYSYVSNKWVSAIGLIYVNPDTGGETLVAIAATPKFQKTAGIGGTFVFKVPVSGEASTPIFKEFPYVTDAQFSVFLNERDAIQMNTIAGVGLALQEIEKTRKIRIQTGKVKIWNRGVIKGLNAIKSTNATRNISITAGQVFLDGRIIPVPELENTANIPNNPENTDKICYLYAYIDQEGNIDVSCTLLEESIPEGGIPLYKVIVPAGNTEANDPYIENVSLINIKRTEPNFPLLMNTSPAVYVDLPYPFVDEDYLVFLECETFVGSSFQLGYIYTGNKARNGFSIYYNGSADQLVVRWRVEKMDL